MNRTAKLLTDFPLQQRALTAFRKAVRKAIAEHEREGLPAYILRDGKVVDALSVKRRNKSRLNGRARTAPARSVQR